MNKTAVGVGVILVILLSVFFFSGKTKTTEKIIITALYPLSGGVASWGEASQRATQIAVAEINDSGGIEGKTLEVVFEDHKCDPKTALSIYDQAVKDNKIFTSAACSGTVLAIAPNLEKDNALLLATVVASVKISAVSPVLFRNWSVEDRQASLIAGEVKNAGYKKIGVIYEETDYAKGLKLALDKLLVDSGVQIVSESFGSSATDVRTQLSKLKSSNVEALFVSPQTEATGEVLLNQIDQIKFSTPLYVNDIISNSKSLLEKHRNQLEGAKGGSYIVDKSDKLAKLLSLYKQKYGTDCPHSNACAVAYDSIYMLRDAIKSKGISADEIKSYLKDVQHNGISGVIKFDENNDRDGVGYSLVIIKDGQIQPLDR